MFSNPYPLTQKNSPHTHKQTTTLLYTTRKIIRNMQERNKIGELSKWQSCNPAMFISKWRISIFPCMQLWKDVLRQERSHWSVSFSNSIIFVVAFVVVHCELTCVSMYHTDDSYVKQHPGICFHKICFHNIFDFLVSFLY